MTDMHGNRKTQQDRVYEAEDEIRGGRNFNTIVLAQDYIDDLRETDWWKRWVPEVLKVHVVKAPAQSKRSSGGYEGNGVGHMRLTRWGFRESVVIHELAHVLAGARFGSNSHDPWFARVHLELTYVIRGSEAYELLRNAYDQHGVEYDATGLAERSDR